MPAAWGRSGDGRPRWVFECVLLSLISTHWPFSLQMPSFPLTSPQSPGTTTSLIEMPLRLSAGGTRANTNPFSFLWCYDPFLLLPLPLFCNYLSVLPKWNHEGMTSRESIFGKMLRGWKNDTISRLLSFTVTPLLFCFVILSLGARSGFPHHFVPHYEKIKCVCFIFLAKCIRFFYFRRQYVPWCLFTFTFTRYHNCFQHLPTLLI